MFGFGGSVKIYYCPTPVNMRKSFDGLAGAVEEYIKQDPESGHVFAFFSRVCPVSPMVRGISRWSFGKN